MRHMVSALWWVALAAIGLAATSCTLFCTDVLYADGLSIEVTIPDQVATYRLEIEAEGETLQLTYEVDALSSTCVNGCGTAGSRLEVDGLFTGGPRQLRALIRRRGEDIGPAKVTVRIYRGDAFLAGSTFEPRYERDEPNGRGCGEHVFGRMVLDVG